MDTLAQLVFTLEEIELTDRRNAVNLLTSIVSVFSWISRRQSSRTLSYVRRGGRAPYLSESVSESELSVRFICSADFLMLFSARLFVVGLRENRLIKLFG